MNDPEVDPFDYSARKISRRSMAFATASQPAGSMTTQSSACTLMCSVSVSKLAGNVRSSDPAILSRVERMCISSGVPSKACGILRARLKLTTFRRQLHQHADYCTLAGRGYFSYPDLRFSYIGFRLARSSGNQPSGVGDALGGTTSVSSDSRGGQRGQELILDILVFQSIKQI